MTLQPAQQKVYDEALKQLKDEPWFKGICCDDFPSEESCKADFDDCISCVTWNTAMWDDPDFYS